MKLLQILSHGVAADVERRGGASQVPVAFFEHVADMQAGGLLEVVRELLLGKVMLRRDRRHRSILHSAFCILHWE